MVLAKVRTQQRFDNAEVVYLRSLTIKHALDLLGLFWKRDPDYEPTQKNAASERLNVSVGGGCFEIIVTEPKWYDTRAERGGGGAIDLTMHLHCEGFATAVKRLRNTLTQTHGRYETRAGLVESVWLYKSNDMQCSEIARATDTKIAAVVWIITTGEGKPDWYITK